MNRSNIQDILQAIKQNYDINVDDMLDKFKNKTKIEIEKYKGNRSKQQSKEN